MLFTAQYPAHSRNPNANLFINLLTRIYISMCTLIIDNYDSFTYNLVHLLYTLNAQVEVRRNREITVDEAIGMNPDAILLSPGPGRPENAGVMPQLIKAVRDRIPLLGVCLGHQAIGQSFGAEVVSAASVEYLYPLSLIASSIAAVVLKP